MNRTDDIAQTMRKLFSLGKGELERVFMGLIILMALWSCSKEQAEPEPEPVEPPVTPVEKEICFTGFLQEEEEVLAGTRAENTPIPLKDIFTSFRVWAFKNKGVLLDDQDQPVEPTNYTNPQCVFPYYTVSWAENSANTTVTNSSGWEYVNGNDQTIKYWDWDAKAYRFFGYAPADARIQTDFFRPSKSNEADGTWEEYEPLNGQWPEGGSFSSCRMKLTVDANYEEDNDDETNNPYFSRLWFSNGNTSQGQQPFGEPVLLKFFKPLAKVRFMFTFSSEEMAAEMTIEEPIFRPTDPYAGIPMSGDISFEIPLTGIKTTTMWNSTPRGYMMDSNGDNIYFTQDWYTLTNAELLTASEEMKANREKWYTVFPVKGQGSYTLTAIISGADQKADVPPEFMQWDPGYYYTYIFKIMQDGEIKFNDVQVAIKNWIISSQAERTVYNW